VIEEINCGTAVARYTRTQRIDEPLAMLRSGATSYYDFDGLGSVTSLSAGWIYGYDCASKLEPFQTSDLWKTGPAWFPGQGSTVTLLYYTSFAATFGTEHSFGISGAIRQRCTVITSTPTVWSQNATLRGFIFAFGTLNTSRQEFGS
jgi:hypothetical protein